MATLLHLSDLHLAGPESEDVVSDVKNNVIARASQQTSFDGVRQALAGVAAAIRAGRISLDCIVITGDIADKNDPAGYSRLPALLAPLVPEYVEPHSVVVVPGNHDIEKGSRSSSPERYQQFLTLRTNGYLTPLLEGVDITDGGLGPRAESPVYLAPDHSMLVVALNSANHSQAPDPIDMDVEAFRNELAHLAEQHHAVRVLWDSWRERGEHDPCWIDPTQLRHAAEALQNAIEQHPHALRIAALHHQLLPVTTTAEIKTFETMINLGEALGWIASNKIDVVLHGHKHVGRVVEHLSSPALFGAPDAARRVLAIGGPQGQQPRDGSSPLARLIDVAPGAPRTSGVRVADVHPVGAGGVAEFEFTTYVLDDDARRGLVRGRTAEEVHRKLLALPSDRFGVGQLLTCVIDNGASALKIVPTYRDAPVGEDEIDKWFDTMLDWWQASPKSTAAEFNHGERLRAYSHSSGGSREAALDQLRQAAESLKHKESSSRAIAVLVDPTRDLSDAAGPDFPAFSLVQFAVRADRLDVVAYFRKQEMPHWWPFNVGELARLQRDLARLLGRPNITPGSITTITPHPVGGGSVPRVAVPSLDQRVDSPTGLLELVLPLFTTAGYRDADNARDRWASAFADWAPQADAPADGDPMPLTGLGRLSDLLTHVGQVHGKTSAHDDLRRRLLELRTRCQEWRSKSETETSSASRPTWVAEWQTMRDQILDVVSILLDGETTT